MVSNLRAYPVNELFQSIQGEGYFTGVPAIFIRLQGCPVACPWCDTRHTWVVDPNHEVAAGQVVNRSNQSASWASMTSADLLLSISRLGYQARHIVLTGGEPCLYDLRELSRALLEQGFRVQIETSGTHEILADNSCWVTVSPKVGMKGGYVVLDSALARANEIKHPVAMEKHIPELEQLLARCERPDEKIVCLQPISQQPRATALAIEVCQARNWRLSVQMHKYLRIE